MRPIGRLRTARGLRAGDHVGWALGAREDIGSLTHELLLDADERGDRFFYVGWRSSAELLADLRPLEVSERLQARGAVEVMSTAELTERAGASPLHTLVAQSHRAVADGFASLRVLTDSTGAVATDASRASFVAWEHEVDREIRQAPLVCVCAYDRSVLGEAAITELLAVHPKVSEQPPVQVFTTDTADLGLAGELDIAALDLLELLLDRLPPTDGLRALVVDARGVDFIDHRNLLALERYAQRWGLDYIELLHVPRVAGRILELVPLPHLRIGTAS